ncbi:hypothetical protein U1Q18_007991, partial [Sarracenia purpurea var. burkii]
MANRVGTGEVRPPVQQQPPPVQQQPAAVQQQTAVKKRMRVMVAVDESEGSFFALKWVLDHLFPSTGGGATAELNQDLGMVTVVHVQQPFQPYIYPAGP